MDQASKGTALPASIRDSCDAALEAHRTCTFLRALLGRLTESSPSYRVVVETLDLVEAGWVRHVGAAGSIAASCSTDILLKASLLSRVIERDEADRVTGGPALVLAASLADDILVRLAAASR